MERHAVLVVRLQVDTSKEQEFNDWYREYLDTLRPIAPDFVEIHRYVSQEENPRTYLTIYQISSQEAIDRAMAAFDREDRQSWRKEWKEWESSALHDVSAEIYLQIYP